MPLLLVFLLTIGCTLGLHYTDYRLMQSGLCHTIVSVLVRICVKNCKWIAKGLKIWYDKFV